MKILHIVVATIALFSLHVEAQTPGKIVSIEWRIMGRVLDAGTGAPLAGVVVRGPGALSQPPEPSTTTNAEGKYSLTVKSPMFVPPKVVFSKTGWGPNPRELIVSLSGIQQADILLADLKGSSGYYSALAQAMVDSAAKSAGKPPQLEAALSLPPERKAETFRVLQSADPQLYSGVVIANQNYGTVKQLREKFASSSAPVTADFDWSNPGRVVLTGSVRSQADKAKILEEVQLPIGNAVFTDNLKIDKSAPAFSDFMAHQPK
ncbi:carboxypeptidase-like regulatory domain-containing protein [Pseudorhodoferax sp. Leaf265]|uniref:carboxypeptidase-like regulatory domain-containing protein n=1 Tax=Pseudorhodoferax sp. Leaf265 TaxID=1736315 RepID=UPI0012E92219|nr:carboxypeptidase-like regulatory domain-containing protein [Pseudorhodoferax sp. Leaf265]